MQAYPISNAHAPLNNINGGLVNTDSSHVGGIPFANNKIPVGPQTLAAPAGKVGSAAGIYPCASQKGGKRRPTKINRRKINKISRKYKMRGSKKTIKRRVRKMKSRVRSRYARSHKHRRMSKRRSMKGGAYPVQAPNYPAGHVQFDNNKMYSNTYSTGGPLSAGSSALASPPPIHKVAPDPDNLDHSAVNAFGKYGAGSGFPSRGWF